MLLFINALDNALIADKYDQMPNEKGKVKPKFHKANQDRLYPLRPYIISAGQEAMKKNDAKEAYKKLQDVCRNSRSSIVCRSR